MFIIFLTRISNFIQIKCYLLFDQEAYFLCLIFFYQKHLKFKYIIDDTTINV